MLASLASADLLESLSAAVPSFRHSPKAWSAMCDPAGRASVGSV